MEKNINLSGKRWTVRKSDRKSNQNVAIRESDGFRVYFGDPKMPEYPGTKRGDSYCTRSQGIGNTNDETSANFWSRKFLWNCVGKKSLDRKVI